MELALGDFSPQTSGALFIAPSVDIIGNVHLGQDVSVWYGSVLRAEHEPITIGEGSNLQDGVVMHTDPRFPATVGAGVSVGHRAVLHGCTVEDNCLIGMGAVVLNGAVIGEGSLVAAGALVPQGAIIPPRSLVAGVPGKVRRELTDDQVDDIRNNAAVYVDLARRHAAAHQQ